MTTAALELPAAKMGSTELSLAGFLRILKTDRSLPSLLHRAVLQEFLVGKAREIGVTIADGELQLISEAIRRRQGLLTANDTNAWLSRESLTVDDWEWGLERGLLLEKLGGTVVADKIEAHFKANPSRYDLLRLRQLTVGKEDLAKELLSQIRTEGAKFIDLVRKHSKHPTVRRGGLLPSVLRRDLHPAVAEALVNAKQGDVVGPVATKQGIHLLLVEKFVGARLNQRLAAVIRAELFDQWLVEQMRGAALELPLMSAV